MPAPAPRAASWPCVRRPGAACSTMSQTIQSAPAPAAGNRRRVGVDHAGVQHVLAQRAVVDRLTRAGGGGPAPRPAAGCRARSAATMPSFSRRRRSSSVEQHQQRFLQLQRRPRQGVCASAAAGCPVAMAHCRRALVASSSGRPPQEQTCRRGSPAVLGTAGWPCAAPAAGVAEAARQPASGLPASESDAPSPASPNRRALQRHCQHRR